MSSGRVVQPPIFLNGVEVVFFGSLRAIRVPADLQGEAEARGHAEEPRLRCGFPQILRLFCRWADVYHP